MSQTGPRRTRDKMLFALAYGAVIVAILFLHPQPGARETSAFAVAAEGAR